MIHPDDLPRWRHKLDQIEAAVDLDEEVKQRWAKADALRPTRDAEARNLVSELIATRDFAAFRAGSDKWSRQEGPYNAFSGFGQMWLNQVANNLPDDPEALNVLVRAFTTPATVDEARSRFAEVERVTRDLASKGQPAVGRIPYVLSVFWSTDRVRPGWPVMWKSAPERMWALGWLRTWENADRYLAVVEAARAFYPDDVHRFERLMWFLSERQGFVGVNPAVREMCDEATGIMATYEVGARYPDEERSSRAAALAAQLKGELHIAAKGLLADLRAATGLELETSQPQDRIASDKAAAYRADAYATWSLPGAVSAAGLRLWATRSGLALGLYDWRNPGAGAALAMGPLPSGHRFFEIRPHLTGDRLVPVDADPGGSTLVGKWWPWSEVPPGLALRGALLEEVGRLKPLVRLVAGQGEAVPATIPEGENLAAALARFKAERPYPNDKDEWHAEQRQQFAEALSPENLTIFDLDQFRLLVNGKRYGNPGPQSVLNASLSGMDSVALDAFANKLREVLFGDGEVAARIDRGLDWKDLGTKGLGESVLLKLFAVTDPRRFLPIFPLTGPMGKIAMLRRFGLAEPDGALSRGQQHVEANDRLRATLEQMLPGDPWGQGQFAYWMLNHDAVEPVEEEDHIARTARDLLLPELFLHELAELLHEKGQIIFYGPPGTGKTYLADRLASALQQDPERRMLVQFHPSTSYEDFFEGYRPRTDERGQLTYELRSGPLALMAEKAESNPGVPHYLIIDEINRANLPRVFGELLFLLEYRNKAVRTAYRPDEPFELPRNLFFIGTMNTADRSIAMVDAALRRRFHFIPFMPHEGAMRSLLADWLKKNGEPVWVAGLVDQVNERLRVLLKGPHLQVGHSHFMRQGLTDERLARIWEYDVYPFIEDQLYGRPDQLEQFAWAKVHAAYGPSSASGSEAMDATSDDSDESSF
ncbi:5-methylcytosine-specific restriction enzyme B [Micromonospora nigra]|uniref:5-methylcytosine-specific restriction enzyme B n=1 Tax=Micromonospora nigra TaxID=145857 RepID=A0A1C6RD86_9ACTN|nr:AAA family ATPase [Micromonospora nigra]SCL15056.1 5-methylcytosine-specific restriction enzyme B [Micromonospora nigra]